MSSSLQLLPPQSSAGGSLAKSSTGLTYSRVQVLCGATCLLTSLTPLRPRHQSTTEICSSLQWPLRQGATEAKEGAVDRVIASGTLGGEMVNMLFTEWQEAGVQTPALTLYFPFPSPS